MTQYEITLPLDDVAELREAAEQVMQIESFAIETMANRQVLRLRGRLLFDPDTAYRQVTPLFRARNYTAMLTEDPLGACLTALPGKIEGGTSRLWLAVLLFVLTIFSTIFSGGLNLKTGIPINLGPLADPSVTIYFNIWFGLGFSAAMLSILLAHEMGHYLVSRRLGIAVSFPFFIPLPFSPLGTMGAFIQMKEPPTDRRAVLAIAIAGPLAGLIVALPVLFLGLSLSHVGLLPTDGTPYSTEGNSLIYALVKFLMFGRFLPSNGEDVMIHPVALAGWAGLLVTGLNLIPAGQLDGGHILYSLVGRRIARYVSIIIPVILVGMGFLWNGWWLWAVLITIFGQQHAPVLNDLTPLNWRLRALAVVGLIVFVLVFIPIPMTPGP